MREICMSGSMREKADVMLVFWHYVSFSTLLAPQSTLCPIKISVFSPISPFSL